MQEDYRKFRQELDQNLAKLGSELPGPMSGFARLHRKVVEDGALSRKIKEMMALAISVATGCEGCIAYHTHAAIQAGATRAELLETVGVGILMGGGPATIYATYAMQAIEQFLPAPEWANEESIETESP
jgi:AhpD family alkylhydroperoxidase